MRFLGLAVFLLGAAATGYALRGAFERPRAAAAIAYGLAASLTVLAALTGLLLVFVPGFFS